MNAYERTYTVRWSDIDANWHMRNTAYAEIGTDLRLTYLGETGFKSEDFQAAGFGPVILREETRYLRELVLGGSVTVNFKISGISKDGSHFELYHEVRRDDGVLSAIMQVEGGWLDLTTRKLRVPPPQLLESFNRLEKTEGFRELVTYIKNRA